MAEQKSFVVACMNFFGKKEGQGLPDFKKEIDKLTNKDRREIAEMFSGIGITIDPATIENVNAPA